MDELQKAKLFASKRAQAERNVKSHIKDILSSLAKDITDASAGISLVSSEAMFRDMLAARTKGVVEDATEKIDAYVKAYSKASITILGDKDTGATGRLLNSLLFGKTYKERNDFYMKCFLDDVVKIIIAGKRLKMRQKDIEKAVDAQYEDPYTNGIIDRANSKGANITIPSYGRGIFHSAYSNIVRNAQGTISIAWGRENRNFASRSGAIGFRTFRNSTYPCPICDDSAAVELHPMDDPVPPLHLNCVCGCVFIYDKGE